MAQRKESRPDPPTLDGVLGFFGLKWASFWAWMDSVDRNAQPVPTSHASEEGPEERPKIRSPPA